MSSLIDRMDGITFKQNNAEVSPQEVFDEFYGGLEDLLKHNRNRSDVMRQRVAGDEGRRKEQEREFFKKWRDSIPKNIEASVTYDGGKKKNLYFQPRLDIETSFSGEAEKRARRQREPNVLFLEDEDGSEAYVFRRAMTYKPHDHAFEIFNEQAGNKHDNFSYSDFLPEDANPYEHGKKGGELFIPEPFLLVGLERAFSTYNIPRTSPKHRHVVTDEDEHKSYVLRPYLDSVRSRPADSEKFVGYLASLHSLGLTDSYDRQPNHYCLEKGETTPPAPIVNIDPDYICHVGSMQQKLNHDRSEFFDSVTKFQQNILEEDYDWFREKYREMRDGHDYQDEFRDDLVPRDIKDIPASYDQQLLR